MNVSWTLLLAGKCAMLFIISTVKIHISDIWNLNGKIGYFIGQMGHQSI